MRSSIRSWKRGCSVAVPGGTIAALDIGTQAMRVSCAALRTRFLPVLRQVARDLGAIGLT